MCHLAVTVVCQVTGIIIILFMCTMELEHDLIVRRHSLKFHKYMHFVIKASNLLYMLLKVLQKDLDIGPHHNFNPWSLKC